MVHGGSPGTTRLTVLSMLHQVVRDTVRAVQHGVPAYGEGGAVCAELSVFFRKGRSMLRRVINVSRVKEEQSAQSYQSLP